MCFKHLFFKKKMLQKFGLHKKPKRKFKKKIGQIVCVRTRMEMADEDDDGSIIWKESWGRC